MSTKWPAEGMLDVLLCEEMGSLIKENIKQANNKMKKRRNKRKGERSATILSRRA
jgi:hypothetical protein